MNIMKLKLAKQDLVQEGNDISIITYGAGVHWAIDYANSHPEISFIFLILERYCRWIMML